MKRRVALLGLGLVAGGVILSAGATSAFSKSNAARAAVIKVTAGDPTEYTFKLSKYAVSGWTAKTTSLAVTFAFKNDAALAHSFKVCTKPAKTASLSACTGPATKVIAAGKTANLVVTFKKKGTYEYLSTATGDVKQGMKGLFGVGVPVKAPTAGGTTGTTTTATTTTGGGSTTTTTGSTALIGDPVAGAAVFASNGCGSCHTLAAAGTNGTIGPNLNLAKPDQNTVKFFVTNGGGGGGNVMPPFTLSTTDLNNLAAYVYKSTH